MVELKEVISSDDKSSICNGILRALPEWFGIEGAIVGYTEQVRKLPFYAAYDNSRPVGFIALKVHNPFAAEVCVMGILEEYHRSGIGKKLVALCEEHCMERDIEFLTVKTLDGSAESKGYERTRLFYLSVGFKPLEVFPLLWDENNPCLYMAKTLKGRGEPGQAYAGAVSEIFSEYPPGTTDGHSVPDAGGGAEGTISAKATSCAALPAVGRM